jgi:hypothetical protein
MNFSAIKREEYQEKSRNSDVGSGEAQISSFI